MKTSRVCYNVCMKENKNTMKVQTKAQCQECERVFDLIDEDEASEFYYGHDCEG